MRYAALIAAAGSSHRMGAGAKKEYRLLDDGQTVLDRAVRSVLDGIPNADVVVVVPPGGDAEARAALSADLRDSARFVDGGKRRQDSVLLGLRSLAAIDPPEIVLIHDAARPWVSPKLVAAVASGAALAGACVPVVPSVDTMKRLDASGTIVEHLPRSMIFAVQTPQAFDFRRILSAHEAAASDGFEHTDDAEIYAKYVGPVSTVQGDVENRKITFPDDIAPARTETAIPEDAVARSAPPYGIRVGAGWDIHRLVPGRKLLLGGVELPSDVGEDGHSDGDVLIHAVIDAILGAAALGDIGSHFPPSDERYAGISSRILLRRTAALVMEEGYGILGLDSTVILEKPRVGPFVDAIRALLAEDMRIETGNVSVKCKTSEGVDAVGRGEAVEASAVCILARTAGSRRV